MASPSMSDARPAAFPPRFAARSILATAVVDFHSIESLSGGGWRFLHPDGRHFEIDRRPRPDHSWEDLQESHTELGIHIDHKTAATRWRGERMDYELGVWVLCQQAERGRERAATQGDVSAETSKTSCEGANGI
jgi:hypothetical protein